MNYRVIFLSLVALNIGSALLFMFCVDRPVFDDIYNSGDIDRYVSLGINTDSIRAHINPAAPGSYIWVSLIAPLIHQNSELFAYRASILLSWIILLAGLYLFSLSNKRNAWVLSAAIPMLVFPHTLMASALILTEGPSLLLSISGSLLWVHSLKYTSFSTKNLLLAISGSAFIGLAIFCRQYYLALLPAMLIVGVTHVANSKSRTKRLFVLGISSLVASLPCVYLLVVWGGLTSAGMSQGESYNGVSASVNLNVWRPVIVLFYLLVYTLPFTISNWATPTWIRSKTYLMLAIFGGTFSWYFASALLQEGPLKSLYVGISSHVIYGGALIMFLIGALATVNIIRLFRSRSFYFSSDATPMILFAGSFLTFFVLENLGVGGDISFYERYTLQAIFFVGVIVQAFEPQHSKIQFPVLSMMFLASHAMLWRYAT